MTSLSSKLNCARRCIVIDKWSMAKYLIDAKKNVDSILFIEENIDKVCNLNLRRKIEELRREFYINCCVVLDKSHPKNKKKICEDKLIEAIYYERDKNCAHRDDDYKSPEFNQLSDMIETMKQQIQQVLVVCKDSLPNNITLDFVSHDKELFRLIYGITAEKEEEIKHRKYPEYGKTPQSGDFITKKVFQEAEDIRTIKNKNEYAVMIEDGINFYEALQNRQDACIKMNVLYNLETWCSINQESFAVIQKLKKAGALNEFDIPVMPKDNVQLEEFMRLLSI